MNNKTTFIRRINGDDIKNRISEVLSKYSEDNNVKSQYGEIYCIDYDLDTNEAILYDAGEFAYGETKQRFRINYELNNKEIEVIKKIINNKEYFIEIFDGQIFLSVYRISKFELYDSDMKDLDEMLNRDNVELGPDDFSDPDDYDDYIKYAIHDREYEWDRKDKEGLILPDGRLLFNHYNEDDSPFIISKELSEEIKYNILGGN